MTNDEKKELCLSLLRADTERDVEAILKKRGYWDDLSVWREIGDMESNFSTIGNQQSRPEAALAEKIINSVDARLLNECLLASIDPISSQAPSDIRAAVAKFFGQGGHIGDWPQKKRKSEAEHITLTATGMKRKSCITIADKGEGQTPIRIPDTFMSIAKSNKIKIPFVQGKFNMGGTGVLKFCGEKSFQLIITRRNPEILTKTDRMHPSASEWGFTITRRIPPKGGAGNNRNSVFMYLTPEKDKNVLSFSADAMPLMPHFNEPYKKEITFGTAIKLYDYDMKGFTSHILMKDGLLYRLECLLPEIALPVDLHECRGYGGEDKGSFVTTLSGLAVRLEQGKGGNLEDGFPDSVLFNVGKEAMKAKIYAFKDQKAETYRTNEGVIFTINGQTHGYFPKTIFGRNKVRLGRLTSSLLVLVDCSSIDSAVREDLFMNSRDRLSQHSLRKEIESEIEDILGNHKKLRELSNKRKQEDIENKLADSKPLEEILKSIMDNSPTLRSLLPNGQRLGDPFNFKLGEDSSNNTGIGRNGKDGDGPGGKPFVGKRHPTFFRLEKKKAGELLVRNFQIGRRCRLTFITDAENEYFSRDKEPGIHEIIMLEGGEDSKELEMPSNLVLHDGIASWSIKPSDSIKEDETITLQFIVKDEVTGCEFINVVKLTAKRAIETPSSKSIRRSSSSGGGGKQPTQLSLPKIVDVSREDWDKYSFDEYSALEAMQEEDGSYTFYINISNKYLLIEGKGSKAFELVKAQFRYGLVLVGIALLQEHHSHSEIEDQDELKELIGDKVKDVTKAVAAVIIPIIRTLSKITENDISSDGQSGDEE